MATQNTQGSASDNVPVLLIGLAGLICFLLLGHVTSLMIIVGIVLFLLLYGYRGRICETRKGRFIYSAIWALNFLIIADYFLFWLEENSSWSHLDFLSVTRIFGQPASDLVPLVIWLIAFFICKIYYDRNAASSQAPDNLSQAPTNP
jgi:hypothetical protein